MRRFWFVLGLTFLVWTLWSALTLVQPGERAVVRRFGRVLDNKPGPGLFVGLPWGFDQVQRFAVNLERQVTVGWTGGEESDSQAVLPEGQLLTGDHNLVNVKATVYYSVVADEVDRFALQADRAEILIGHTAETLLAEWSAGRSIDDVLRLAKSDLPVHVTAHTQERLAGARLGVRIQRTTIELAVPESVKKAFDLLAENQLEAGKKINQAKKRADKTKREADAEIVSILDGVKAYAAEQRSGAQADAVSFRQRLESYRKMLARDPDSLNHLWQDEMTRLYARMREGGRIDVLDHYLTGEGLSITQFPLLPKKK